MTDVDLERGRVALDNRFEAIAGEAVKLGLAVKQVCPPQWRRAKQSWFFYGPKRKLGGIYTPATRHVRLQKHGVAIPVPGGDLVALRLAKLNSDANACRNPDDLHRVIREAADLVGVELEPVGETPLNWILKGSGKGLFEYEPESRTLRRDGNDPIETLPLEAIALASGGRWIPVEQVAEVAAVLKGPLAGALALRGVTTAARLAA